MGLPGCSIPEGDLPQCWSDDVRMNALFAPFRIKTTNPESWDMKMKFWSDMLRQWCQHRKDPIVSAADAKAAFTRKGRTPACLDIVVEELFHNGDLSPLSKYQQILHNGPEGWVKWGARLAFKPAAFAVTALASFLPARQSVDNDGLPKACIDSTQRFVLESAVKDQALELLQNYPPDVDRIGTIEELMRNCEWSHSKETFELLLGYLVSQGYAVKKEAVIKLAEPDKKVSPVTESDEAMVKLMSAARKLQTDGERLARDVAAAHMDASVALKLGNKLVAKNHLRRKHKTQQRLDRCTSALDNVTHLLQQLRDAHVNVTLVDTYRTSSEAMKQNMKENGMTEDAVHDTMDDLKDVMETYSEVEKALGSTVEDFDAAELEEELKELLSSPGAPGGGTPGKEEKKESKLSSPTWKGRKTSEREFVFDGEARMLAELNQLDVEDNSLDEQSEEPARTPITPATPEKKKVAVAVAEAETVAPSTPTKPSTPKSKKPSKAWYPPSGEWSRTRPWTNNNNDCTLTDIAGGFGELHLDERLHPGQKLTMDFSSPPRLYSTDFQVRDHKLSAGVWLYNTRDNNSNIETDLAHSTEYFSSESPGKSSSGFQMAPGGERRRSSQEPWPQEECEDLERRLKNLRGFNL